MAKAKKKSAAKKTTTQKTAGRKPRTDYSKLPSVTKANIAKAYLNGVREKGLKELLLSLDATTVAKLQSILGNIDQEIKQQKKEEIQTQIKALQDELKNI